MRLFELTGYRDKPETQAVRDGLKGLEGKPDQATRESVLKQFLSAMSEKGYTSEGHGVFGAVLSHPGLNYVVKVFNNDSAYLAFARYALSHQQNPMMPRFRGKIMKLGDKYFAVRLERLEPNPKNAITYSRIAVLHFCAICMFFERMDSVEDFLDYTQTCVDKKQLGVMRSYGCNTRELTAAISYLSANENAIETVMMMREFASRLGFEMDVRFDNFMHRGDQLVMTDPIWDPRAIA